MSTRHTGNGGEGTATPVQALEDRGTARRRWWLSPWLLIAAVIVLAAAGAAAYAVSRSTPAKLSCASASCVASSGSAGSGSSGSDGGSSARSGHGGRSFRLASSDPVSGATGIPSDTTLTLTFDAALKRGDPMPVLSPAVAGTWAHPSAKTLVFDPSTSFVPYQAYTLTLPGGDHGVLSTSGAHLAATGHVDFTIADGSMLRLQQLLAQLDYLPLSFDGATPPAVDMATPQSGTFAWRWQGLPAELTDQWAPGSTNSITKGAVMMFETENGLSVDGVAGPRVWSTVFEDAASHKTNTEPLTYVLVTKLEPEHLTAWVNGALAFTHIPVNTGVAGATTTDGTFQVFEHVPYSDMKGTDVTGTKYTDPHVPWASYFDGGEALHGFPRATYGWPQSNGCVEMPISTAGKIWPYTPIGTLVTVMGPSAGGPVPALKATTTTTTTTTAPKPPPKPTTPTTATPTTPTTPSTTAPTG